MGGLTELILSLCSLLEAEGRLLQENVLRTLFRALLLLTGVLFSISALGFFMAGIYNLLERFMPCWLAFACLGLLSVFISFILFWSARQWGKKESVKPATRQGSPD